jgi:hypothetical protein
LAGVGRRRRSSSVVNLVTCILQDGVRVLHIRKHCCMGDERVKLVGCDLDRIGGPHHVKRTKPSLWSLVVRPPAAPTLSEDKGQARHSKTIRETFVRPVPSRTPQPTP